MCILMSHQHPYLQILMYLSEKMSNNAKWAFPSVEGVVVFERKKEIEHEVNTCIVPLIYMNM